MKIAVPYWRGRISPVFDAARLLCLLEIENGREIRRKYCSLNSRDAFSRAKELSDMEAEVLICGAVSNALETALIGSGLHVLSFCCGDLEEIVQAFLQGKIKEDCFLMPGAEKKGSPPRGQKGK